MGMFGAPSYILRQEGKDDQLFFGQGELLKIISKKFIKFSQTELNYSVPSWARPTMDLH